MKIVFMGTPEFAVASLEVLYNSGHEVALVVTQPDKPKGRGYTLTPSEVKKYALEHGTEVITPATLKDESVIEKLESVQADMFIVTAYGKILSQRVLDIPKLGCFNVHASLLPYLRGAAPINRALMNGDKVGGVTIMYLDAGMDTGDIVLQKEIEIPDECDAGEYHDMLANLGKEALSEFLKLAESGNIPRTKQDNEKATYAAKIENEDCFIDFHGDAEEIYNKIRGLNPFPAAYCFIGGKRIKIRKAVRGDGSGIASTVIRADKKGIEIACGSGSIVIKQLCSEGKGVCDAASYLNGHKTEIGTLING